MKDAAEALPSSSVLGSLPPETSRLFQVHKMIIRMVQDRGYIVQMELRDLTLAAFVAEYGEKPSRADLTMLVVSASWSMRESNPCEISIAFVLQVNADDDGNKMFVFFEDAEKVDWQPIQYYQDKMVGDAVFNALLVIRQSITLFARQAVRDMGNSYGRWKNYSMDLFTENDLLVEIAPCLAAAEHHVLTPDEKRTLVRRYCLLESQLARIQPYDPMSRYFGMAIGTVIKITRPSETPPGRYVTYRICEGDTTWL